MAWKWGKRFEKRRFFVRSSRLVSGQLKENDPHVLTCTVRIKWNSRRCLPRHFASSNKKSEQQLCDHCFEHFSGQWKMAEVASALRVLPASRHSAARQPRRLELLCRRALPGLVPVRSFLSLQWAAFLLASVCSNPVLTFWRLLAKLEGPSSSTVSTPVVWKQIISLFIIKISRNLQGMHPCIPLTNSKC